MDAVADAPEEAGEKPKGHRYSPGNDIGKHGRKGKPLKKKRGETQLEAMRWVLENQENQSPLQKEMRRYLRESREKFMGEKAMLEKAAMERPTTPTSGGSNGGSSGSSDSTNGQIPPTPLTPDVGTARCVELAEALIKRLKEARGKR